jgi:predicted transcriptional regulator
MKKAAKKKAAAKKLASKGLGSPRGASAPKASTIRLKPELRSALHSVSVHLNRPKNKLVNQAVAEFLERTTFKLRDDLEGTLQKLRDYRREDPTFEADIERFVAAESSLAAEDAHEGEIQSSSAPSLTKEIQDLIHA